MPTRPATYTHYNTHSFSTATIIRERTSILRYSALSVLFHLGFGLRASLVDIGCQSQFLAILSFVIGCTWKNRFSLWDSMLLIIFLFLIKLFNSSFVVILHLPSLSFARPNILLDILLPIINNFYFIDLFNTRVSIAYMLSQDHNYGPV
jgi:hypothetical protein